MRVAVVGTGHVGLVTAASLAHLGHTVVGIDQDEEKIARLEKGASPFFEPGLDALVAEGTAAGRLAFATEAAEGVPGADVIFICVGTPAKASGEASLIAVERAAVEIARHITGPAVVVEKSTVPAGTARRLEQVLARRRPDIAGDIEVAFNPEFLREGRAVQDSLKPDRILVGARSRARVRGAAGALRTPDRRGPSPDRDRHRYRSWAPTPGSGPSS